MKKLVNFINTVRSKIWNESRTTSAYRFRFRCRTYAGLLRGYISCMLGRVKYDGDYRPLILGNNIDFDLWSGGDIVLKGKNNVADVIDPANDIYPTATSIGVSPHYDHINVSMSHPTRLRIRNRAKLTLEPNTCILPGCYIAIAHDMELKVGAETYIAHGVVINTRCGMNIGKNVMIGHESTIMDYDGHPIFTSDPDASNTDTYGGRALPINIEDNVWIGFKTTILKGVTIGTGSIIGANSCVTTNIPPNSIAVGSPAKVVKENILWQRY